MAPAGPTGASGTVPAAQPPATARAPSRFPTRLAVRVPAAERLRHAAGGEWPDDPEARYAAIGEELDALWRHQGGHALLHHLNTVFGYREVSIVRRELMRF